MKVDRVIYTILAACAITSAFGFWAIRQIDKADWTVSEGTHQ